MSQPINPSNESDKERRGDRVSRATDREHGARANRAGDQGIARNPRGQEQPKDKARAQQTSGEEAQRQAARDQPLSPGQPAGGE